MSMPAQLMSTDLTLQTLLQGIADAPPVAIQDIATDSRNLAEGSVFLACAGGTTHGIAFADQALQAGVAAIVFDSATADAPDIESDTPIIAVPGLQKYLGASRIGTSRWGFGRGVFTREPE